MSNYTFLLKTPLDLLKKAERELARMRSARKHDLKSETDHAFNLAITLWQLTDWVIKCEEPGFSGVNQRLSKKEFRSYLFKHCPELEICSEIADGSKHFLIDRKSDQEKVIAGVLLSVPSSPKSTVKYPVLKVVLKEGGSRKVEEVFKVAINFWKKILAKRAGVDFVFVD